MMDIKFVEDKFHFRVKMPGIQVVHFSDGIREGVPYGVRIIVMGELILLDSVEDRMRGGGAFPWMTKIFSRIVVQIENYGVVPA